mmetsp:Transcript_15422/g.31698  ORF Transcript_15422/g.31698 Transcript_15422/m.31698 type:complete len:217 (-) Transcript_15422:202-852(-)
MLNRLSLSGRGSLLNIRDPKPHIGWRLVGGGPRVTLTPVVEWARLVLKVTAGASASKVKSAYREAAVACHPDRHPAEQKRKATKKFQRCSEAFAILRTHPDHQHAEGVGRRSPSSGGDSSKSGPKRPPPGTVHAESLFREAFRGLSDTEVMRAIMKNKVGAISGMGMLSLRRIRRQVSSKDTEDLKAKAAAAGAAFAWKSSKGTEDNRWPWRPEST